MSITALQQRLHKLLNDRFLRNIGWLGSAQLANRVLRLCATIIVARLLLPEDYGLAALVLASHEFIQMFCRQGTGPRLVQARDDELPQLAQTAYWLNWIQCGGLFLLQCLIALP
ncbi:MAG: oligosaccharide flippase family protein, partial [Candidatus Competibacteraceae bacterium]|nr:oligosaccharide flippase family protein [Candidatus Competibacteraceae bacterium]